MQESNWRTQFPKSDLHRNFPSFHWPRFWSHGRGSCLSNKRKSKKLVPFLKGSVTELGMLEFWHCKKEENPTIFLDQSYRIWIFFFLLGRRRWVVGLKQREFTEQKPPKNNNFELIFCVSRKSLSFLTVLFSLTDVFIFSFLRWIMNGHKWP